jgi:transcriptional regulator with XRE-family HTH domain
MIGDRIRQIRLDSNLTTEDFCNKVKISLGGLSNIESGVYAPGTNILDNISNTFDIPIRSLLREEFPKSDEEIREENSIIGNNLKRYRKAAGRTQEEIAKLLGLPSAERIELIEQGRVGLSKEQIIKSCDVLGIYITDLMLQDPSDFEHADLIKKFSYLCQSENKPESFSKIKKLINMAVKQQ